MKKIFFALIVAFGLLFSSCVSMVPLQGDNRFPTNLNYKVLGRITTTTFRTKTGYVKLLEEAKKQYPECDDIVNIMVDAKSTTILIFTFHQYTMSAVAIDYLDM